MPTSPGFHAQELGACPSSEAGALAALVGHWRVSASDRLGSGAYEDTEGRSTIRAALGGCGLIETYDGVREAEPYFTVSVFTVAPDSGLEVARLDSGHRQFSVLHGRVDGHALQFVWERDLGDRVLRVRAVYTLQSPDEFVLERHLSRSAGARWELTYRATYRREPEG